MDVTQVATDLVVGAQNILAAEQEVLALEDRRRELLLELQIEEANLLTQENGPINGKNAEIRAAQLLQETAPERIQINEFEREIARKKSELVYQQNLFKASQALMPLFVAQPGMIL